MNEELERQRKLLEVLSSNEQTKEVDKESLRYALYARKSTAGDEKQESSIEDQIRECMERVILPQSLNLVETYEERVSAKIADVRGEFKRLVKDIYSGKINGLIAWHPDRLSRNMKEAGVIIDLIDNGFIKDLQFPTFTFENTPAGKMLLGITFVIAKQYSEHLSESVGRGNRRATLDGEFIGKFKHGYILDTNKQLKPDPDSFVKVKHMFEMALEGYSQKDIRLWINEQHYTVQKRAQREPEAHIWSKDNVSKLLRDSFYTGVLKWGVNYINLCEEYDFEPMITVDDFLKINKIENLDSPKIIAINRPKGGDIRANLLRGMVYCSCCNKPMTSMLIDKKRNGEIYESRYYYKCETIDCSMEGKSARAKFVIDEAKQFFESYLFITESNYDKILRLAKKQMREELCRIDSKIASLKTTIVNKRKNYDNAKNLIQNDLSGKLARHYDLDKILDEIESLETEQKRLLDIKNTSSNIMPSFDYYLKLFKSTSVILDKIRDMKQMDKFLRTFFSNFTITPGEGGFRKGLVVSYKLNEPWEGFVNANDFVRGAG